MLIQSQDVLRVVFNPNAGNAEILDQSTIANYLEKQQVAYQWMSLSELRQLAQQRSDKHHYILIIGGDGTIHAILNTIGHRNLHRFTFGIIPVGTGNDFARSLNIPLQVDRAFEVLSQGEASQVDLGVLNHRVCFTCAMSLGFGPQVTKYATRPMKILLGRFALYLGAILYCLKSQPLHTLLIKTDTEDVYALQTPHLVIGNARTHGGGFPISPMAELDNGKLDLYYVKPIRRMRIPKMFFKALRMKDPTVLEEISHQQVEEVQMVLDRPMDVDVDGDIYLFTRQIHVKVYPSQLHVIRPKAIALQNKPVEKFSWKVVGRNSRAS